MTHYRVMKVLLTNFSHLNDAKTKLFDIHFLIFDIVIFQNGQSGLQMLTDAVVLIKIKLLCYQMNPNSTLNCSTTWKRY